MRAGDLRSSGMLPPVAPMRLLRVPQPFDHDDFVYDVKHDGFRALAYIDGHHCKLVSRGGNTFKSWPYLAEELAHAVQCRSAVIDGEIACRSGRPRAI
jgi:bifunctional non-homologous end joining protein LigD